MVHIAVSKGLDVPISGKPSGDTIQKAVPIGLFSCDVSVYDNITVCVEEGQRIDAGGLIAEGKDRSVVSPVHATVKEVVRGAKRKPLHILLEPDGEASARKPRFPAHREKVLAGTVDRNSVLESLLLSGLFNRFRVRPGDRLASPNTLPRSIFVQAVETAPYVPPAEWQVRGREEAFRVGLMVVRSLTDGNVHVVVEMGSSLISLCDHACVHTVQGPHPSANPSVHIQHIDPIRSAKDVIWTLSALDVVAIGRLYLSGDLWVDSVIAIAGTGFVEGFRKYIRAFPGVSVSSLAYGGLIPEPVRLISGDPLTGTCVVMDGFLNPRHTVLSAIPEGDPNDRELLRFLKLGSSEFTATDVYLGGDRRESDFTTKTHGDVRAFIDGSIYDKVLPFDVLPVPMIKALLADDLDKAVRYGLLEIVPEDFALADFVCPSKIEMMAIIRDGQRKYFSSF